MIMKLIIKLGNDKIKNRLVIIQKSDYYLYYLIKICIITN